VGLAGPRRAQRLVVGADDEVLERTSPRVLEQLVGDRLEVPLDLRLDGALEAGLRPAPGLVLVLDVGVDLPDLARESRAAHGAPA